MAGRLTGIFARLRPVGTDPESRARIRAWVSAALDLTPDASITVSEIACNDPACPGLETVILVMVQGEKTRAFKSRGSAIAQTRRDILAALGIAH